MKLKKCFFCNKLRFAPYHVTEIHQNGDLEFYDMCKSCGWEYVKDAYEGAHATEEINHKKEPNVSNLSEIKTPSDLLLFLTGGKHTHQSSLSCECGMTNEEFHKHGKFGCAKCYDTFHEYVKRFVYSYHQSDEHVGKFPKHQLQKQTESSPEETLKFLKLKLAQAVEFEKYEDAAIINAKIKNLISQELYPSISDQ